MQNKKVFRMITGIFVFVLLCGCGAKTEVKEPIKLDDSYKKYIFDTTTQFQMVEGFGAAYTWYADWLLRCDDQEGAFDALFTDAKMTILRFKNEYEYYSEDKADNAGTMLAYYNAAVENADKYGEKPIVLMSCWSPPAILKTNNDITGGASLRRDEAGNYDYEAYAAWWVESIQYYRAYGINIDYLCIQNEVDYAADYDGCRFDMQETQDCASFAKAYLAVYEAMQEAFGEEAPQMLGPETMSCKSGDIAQYMKEIIENAPDSIYGIAHHLYVGGEGDGENNTVDADSFITNLMNIYNYTLNTNYSRWQTEYYIGHGIDTAMLINNCMVYEEANVYLYWSGVWEDYDEGNYESGMLMACKYDKKDWVTDTGWKLCADYYAMRHFSEFIRPGYKRIKSLTGNVDVRSSAYVNEGATDLVIVLINRSQENINYYIDNKDYVIDKSQIYQSVFGETVTSLENMYMDLGSLGEGNTITLPRDSVTTIHIIGNQK
ncbi:MAG TPA: hypothetical protein VJZ04_05480 [Lachnospiraceae bacterium]|nr:hypothetical protein [Lachnospiraceae bacterium]